MALHFSKEELVERRNKACRAMAKIDLDRMLIFHQESMFYPTGYDTFGYVFFQCLYLGADGVMTLSESVRVTETTPERLSRSSPDLIRK